jgi:hypothetical protein
MATRKRSVKAKAGGKPGPKAKPAPRAKAAPAPEAGGPAMVGARAVALSRRDVEAFLKEYDPTAQVAHSVTFEAAQAKGLLPPGVKVPEQLASIKAGRITIIVCYPTSKPAG